MNIIEEIKAKLQKYPDVTYEFSGNSLTIFPVLDDGFEVSLIIETPDKFTVYFEGWHESFSDPHDALECLSFGLSTECRLIEHRRGDTPYRWVVEYLNGSVWEEDSRTGLLFFPFWKSRHRRVLQNFLIK